MAEFNEGDSVKVKLQLPGDDRPTIYPATVLAVRRPDQGEDRCRYSVRIMDGREAHGVDELLITLSPRAQRKEARNG